MIKIIQYLMILFVVSIIILFIHCKEENNSAEPNNTIITSNNSSTNVSSLYTTYTTNTNNTSTLTTNTSPTGLNWVTIPGGTFLMGNSNYSESLPLHTVQISSFEMLESEVTQGQYCDFLNAVEQSDNGRWRSIMSNAYECYIQRSGTPGNYSYTVSGTYSNYPIVWVTWTNSCDFCQWINGTLPSEAQWEYAAGGPNHYIWSLGNTFVCSSYSDSVDPCESKSKACAVKTYPANGFGLYEMSGNEWEWTYDLYSIIGNGSTGSSSSPNSFYQNCLNAGVVINPVNYYSSSSERIYRGGSYSHLDEGQFSVSLRVSNTPNTYYGDLGFRCIR